MEIKEVPDDLPSLHRAALENVCQNFLNYRAEPVNQDSNSANTPLPPKKGKYSSFSQPTNQQTNQSKNKSINKKKSINQLII